MSDRSVRTINKELESVYNAVTNIGGYEVIAMKADDNGLDYAVFLRSENRAVKIKVEEWDLLD